MARIYEVTRIFHPSEDPNTTAVRSTTLNQESLMRPWGVMQTVFEKIYKYAVLIDGVIVQHGPFSPYEIEKNYDKFWSAKSEKSE